MGIVLALAAAASYGAADFMGGLATRRVSVFQVTFLSQLLGTLLFVPWVLLFPASTYDDAAVAWGAAAGVAGATGVSLLYAALARGRMSIVAPITAVQAAVFPVAYGAAIGERPGPVVLTGVVVALAAVVLVASSPEVPVGRPAVPDRRSIYQAFAAGICFGAFFICLDQAPQDGGLWPLVGARMASLALLTLLVVGTRTRLGGVSNAFGAIAAAGALDLAANFFYLLASRRGLLAVVAVLTSLYPASTILLARVILKERISRGQRVGLAAAAVGVALISGG